AGPPRSPPPPARPRSWRARRCGSAARTRRAHAPGGRCASGAVLRAVVVGLEDLDLADAHPVVVEAAPQLLREEAGQLFRGGVAAALAEGLHLVDVLVIESPGDVHGGR